MDRVRSWGNYLFAATMPVSHIGGYLATLAGIAALPRTGERLKREPVFLGICLFIVYGLSLSVFSKEPVVGLHSMIGYAAHWLLPFMLGYAVLRTQARTVILFWGAVLTALVAASILAYFGLLPQDLGGGMYLAREGLLKGFRSHIALAALCLLASCLCLGQLLVRTDLSLRAKRMLSLSVVFFAGAVFLTGSRGYYIAAFAIYGLIALFWVVKAKRWAMLAAGAAVAIAVVMSLYFLVPSLRDRIQRTGPRDNNVMDRLIIYQIAGREIKDRPVFGFGPGQGVRQAAYFDSLPEHRQNIRTFGHLHSFLLNLGADFGLVGVLIFAGIVTMILIRLWRIGGGSTFEAAVALGLFWGFAAILAGDLFDTLLRGPGIAMEIFWLAGIVLGRDGDRT